jgi:hypothetical protein
VIALESATPAPTSGWRDTARRQAATVDRALRCAEIVSRDLTDVAAAGLAVDHHVRRLRRLARRCEAAGLPRLGETARLAASALTAPRREHTLVDQAVGLLTLASRDAGRGGTARAALDPAIDALRDHLRYAGAGE